MKKENGITLIALIITIIILIILAAVSIRAAYNSGIIDYGVNGTKRYQEEANKEESILSETEDFMKSVLAKIENLSNNNLNENNTNEDDSTTGDDLVTEDGLPCTTGTHPYLPSDDFEKVEGTDLTTGLVIEDKSQNGYGNQFVWVEVPNDGTGPNYSSVTNEEDTEHIAAALIDYVSIYREEGYTDTYYEGCGISSQSAYEELYAEMLTSIYTNGGFWIGRYETGISQTDEYGFRTQAFYTTLQTPVVIKDAYPYTLVTVSQAQVLASGINSGNYTSSLLFGIQYDLVIKHLEIKGNWDTTGGYTAIDYLKRNTSWTPANHGPGSTGWGNYEDSEFTITSENAKRRVSNTSWIGRNDSGWSDIKVADSRTLLTTGANEERNSKMNIVDLAGNVWEWILEYADPQYPCNVRGGSVCDERVDLYTF